MGTDNRAHILSLDRPLTLLLHHSLSNNVSSSSSSYMYSHIHASSTRCLAPKWELDWGYDWNTGRGSLVCPRAWWWPQNCFHWWWSADNAKMTVHAWYRKSFLELLESSSAAVLCIRCMGMTMSNEGKCTSHVQHELRGRLGGMQVHLLHIQWHKHCWVQRSQHKCFGYGFGGQMFPGKWLIRTQRHFLKLLPYSVISLRTWPLVAPGYMYNSASQWRPSHPPTFLNMTLNAFRWSIVNDATNACNIYTHSKGNGAK